MEYLSSLNKTLIPTTVPQGGGRVKKGMFLVFCLFVFFNDDELGPYFRKGQI